MQKRFRGWFSSIMPNAWWDIIKWVSKEIFRWGIPYVLAFRADFLGLVETVGGKMSIQHLVAYLAYLFMVIGIFHFGGILIGYLRRIVPVHSAPTNNQPALPQRLFPAKISKKGVNSELIVIPPSTGLGGVSTLFDVEFAAIRVDGLTVEQCRQLSVRLTGVKYQPRGTTSQTQLLEMNDINPTGQPLRHPVNTKPCVFHMIEVTGGRAVFVFRDGTNSRNLETGNYWVDIEVLAPDGKGGQYVIFRTDGWFVLMRHSQYRMQIIRRRNEDE